MHPRFAIGSTRQIQRDPGTRVRARVIGVCRARLTVESLADTGCKHKNVRALEIMKTGGVVGSPVKLVPMQNKIRFAEEQILLVTAGDFPACVCDISLFYPAAGFSLPFLRPLP